MTYNSAETGVHISDFRAYGTLSPLKSGFISNAVTDENALQVEAELPGENELNVYPNPFTEDFRVNVKSDDDEVYTITVLDLDGRKLFIKPDIQPNTEVTIDHPFKPGMYLLLLEGKNTRKVVRIVKY
jgi:hypothetical protein